MPSFWKPIKSAQPGIGPLFLRSGPSSLDPAYVGYQAQDGRWLVGDQEVHPQFFAEIPAFDADDEAGR